MQQRVARAQRHVEPLGQAQQHAAARRRAASLDEAQVAGGDLGLAGELELAEAAPLAPFAQEIAGACARAGSDGSHG